MMAALAAAEKILANCLAAAINNGPDDEPSLIWFGTDEVIANLENTRTQIGKRFLNECAERYHTEGGSILDIGCGSGADSAVLISSGYKVVSADPSEGMVKAANKYKNMKLEQGDERYQDWPILQCGLLDISEGISADKSLPQTFDNIICLGSTLAYLLTDEEITVAFKKLSDLVRPGGALIVELRNIRPVLERGEYYGLIRASSNVALQNPEARVHKVNPYTVYGPGPEKKPLAILNQYCRDNGQYSYITYNALTRENVTSFARVAFGEGCNIKALYDLQEETPTLLMDSAYITYIIEKPTA